MKYYDTLKVLTAADIKVHSLSPSGARAGVRGRGKIRRNTHQDLFGHFADAHDLILLESEIHDIEHVVSAALCEKIRRLQNENTKLRNRLAACKK